LTTTTKTIDRADLNLPADSFIYDVTFSPDGSRLAVGKEEGPTTVWDITGAEGRVVFELASQSSSTTAVAFSPDGSQLATAGFDSSVKVWDMTQEGQELLSLSAHTDSAIGVAFSPDGKQLASASFDGTARVYVLEVDELIALANSRLTRWFTTDECNRYLHVAICPERDQ
jgi:WD40 repeat protein